MQPRVVELSKDGDALVERLAGDEPCRADALAVLLHEPLQSRAVRGVQDGRPRE